MALSASSTKTTACGTPVLMELTSKTPASVVTFSERRRSCGAVRLMVTRSPWNSAVITPAAVSKVIVGLVQPVARWMYRAKQRAPLPHMAASDPSEL